MTLRWVATSLCYWPLVPVPWVYLSTSQFWHPGRPAEPAGRPALFSASPAHRAELLFLLPQLPSLLQAPEAEPVQSNKKYHEQYTHAILSLLTPPLPPPPPPPHTLSLENTNKEQAFIREVQDSHCQVKLTLTQQNLERSTRVKFCTISEVEVSESSHCQCVTKHNHGLHLSESAKL